jgi:hypothetical protein
MQIAVIDEQDEKATPQILRSADPDSNDTVANDLQL